MQVVILAGGLGTRIRTIAGDLPKSLVTVAGKPFIEHQLELLKENGLNRVLLLIGYQGELIRNYVRSGSRYGMKVTYSLEDPKKLMGTGGALVGALTELEDQFITLYGDSYLPVDFQKMIAWYRDQGRPAAMSVFKNDGKWDASNARVLGERVIFYSKKARKGDADYIDYGLSIFTREIIQRYLTQPMPLDMALIQQDLVESDELAAYRVKQRFYEIGKPEGLRELERYLEERKAG